MQQTTDPPPTHPLEITADVSFCRIILEEMVKALRAGGERGATRNVSLAITKIEDAADRLGRALREDDTPP